MLTSSSGNPETILPHLQALKLGCGEIGGSATKFGQCVRARAPPRQSLSQYGDRAVGVGGRESFFPAHPVFQERREASTHLEELFFGQLDCPFARWPATDAKPRSLSFWSERPGCHVLETRPHSEETKAAKRRGCQQLPRHLINEIP